MLQFRHRSAGRICVQQRYSHHQCSMQSFCCICTAKFRGTYSIDLFPKASSSACVASTDAAVSEISSSRNFASGFAEGAPQPYGFTTYSSSGNSSRVMSFNVSPFSKCGLIIFRPSPEDRHRRFPALHNHTVHQSYPACLILVIFFCDAVSAASFLLIFLLGVQFFLLSLKYLTTMQRLLLICLWKRME